MTGSLFILVPVVVLGIVTLLAFAGCNEPCKPFDAAPTPELPPPVDPPEYPDIIRGEKDLLAYWRLSDVALTMGDAGPHKLHGAYVGGVKPGADGVLRAGDDVDDLAVEFDRALGGHATVPFDLRLNPPTAFSIEAWIRPDFGQAGIYGVLSSFRSPDSADPSPRGFSLAIVQEINGNLLVQVKIGALAEKLRTADLGSATPAGWYHLVVTFNRTGLGKDAKFDLNLYVNGQEVTPNETDNIFYLPLRIGREAPLFVGCLANPVNGQPENFFQGAIDEVALYGKVLRGFDPMNPGMTSQVKKHFDEAAKA